MHVADKTVYVQKIPVGGLKIEKAYRDGDYIVLHIGGNRVAVCREVNIKSNLSYPLRPAAYHWQKAILSMLHKIGIVSEKIIAREVTRQHKQQAVSERDWHQEKLDRMAKRYGFKSIKLKPTPDKYNE